MLEIILNNIFSFIVIISLIVFVHEFGHYFIARLCKVKIEIFSIGFGKEIFGFNDKSGTRWKFCLIPMGGYVKMFGDRNAASMPDLSLSQSMSVEEKKQSFIYKNVYQRLAIVSAGPIANFILTIIIFTIIFRINGLNQTLPIINEIVPNSAAFDAQLLKSDKIIAINGEKISQFSDIQKTILENDNDNFSFIISRKVNGKEELLEINLKSKIEERENIFKEKVKTRFIGIIATETFHKELNLAQSFLEANKEFYQLSKSILKGLNQLITGKRSIEELSGPIKIAKYSGETFRQGLLMVLWFSALISINLGIINLLPLPTLDGGHILFYFFEIILGKPLPQKFQQSAFFIGFTLILSLMLLTLYNDINGLLK